ncbi:lysozyme inhibitor LprI family protein [Pseudomonas oryzicola]|nr:lysozyme inhibitor LprI family protein [Pseudomonas oryzicola]
MFKAICMGSLLVVGTAHADVGREEELDAKVRQFAASVEAVWQECLRRPDVRSTNDSDMCLLAMVRTSNEAVEQKYQKKMVTARELVGHPSAFATFETVPVLLEESQARWKQYAKSDCNGIGAQSAAGTARATYALFCQYKHALQRLRALDEWN